MMPPSSGGHSELKPEFAVNRAGRSVAEAVNGFVTHAATGFVGGAHLDVATAYFNVGGYSLLADSLDHVQGIRLLLGAEPKALEKRRRVLGIESVHPVRAARARLQGALEDHEGDLTTERDLLGVFRGGRCNNETLGPVAPLRHRGGAAVGEPISAWQGLSGG